jgi:hypothetical protein
MLGNCHSQCHWSGDEAYAELWRENIMLLLWKGIN